MSSLVPSNSTAWCDDSMKTVWHKLREIWWEADSIFVGGLYQIMFQRDADEGAKNHIQSLANGLPRTTLVVKFLESAEARQRYIPDDWLPLMYQYAAVVPLDNIHWLMSVEDRHQFIIDCYLRILGRRPSQIEIRRWGRKIRLPWFKRIHFIKGLLNSEERKQLEQTYHSTRIMSSFQNWILPIFSQSSQGLSEISRKLQSQLDNRLDLLTKHVDGMVLAAIKSQYHQNREIARPAPFMQPLNLGNSRWLIPHPVVGYCQIDALDHSLSPKLVANQLDPELNDLLQEIVVAEDVILEYPSRDGYFTLTLATQIKSGQSVIAVESDPSRRELLAENLDSHYLQNSVSVLASLPSHSRSECLHGKKITKVLLERSNEAVEWLSSYIQSTEVLPWVILKSAPNLLPSEQMKVVQKCFLNLQRYGFTVFQILPHGELDSVTTFDAIQFHSLLVFRDSLENKPSRNQAA